MFREQGALMTNSKLNQKNYDIWSEFYDQYPNSTVTIDELKFPSIYSEIENQNILEIGCGSGRHTVRLIQQGNNVTGVDLSEGMLSRAKTKINSSRVTFVHADFLKDEIPNGPFDVAIMSLVLEHIDDLDLFFNKVRKLLKSESKFYFSEIHPFRSQKGGSAHFKTESGEEINLASKSHFDETVIKSALKNGFKVIEKRNILGTKELADINEKWSKYADIPMIQIWSLKSS